MPDLSTQLTALRTSGHTRLGHLSVYEGAVAATFTVDTTYTDSQYPLSAISGTYTTGSESDVGEGFLCEVRTAGGLLRGITRTRYGATQTSTSLKIRELSRGEIVIVSGDVITIKREVRLSDLLVAATAGFEPDGIAYSDQGSNPPPVPNSGGGWAGFVDSGQTYATVAFFGNLSFTLDPDSVSSTSHLWTIPSGGGSFAPGSASTDHSPSIRFNVGSWLLTHVVTDVDNSKSITQYIPIVVEDPASPPLDIITQSLSGEPENGWAYTCSVFDDADLDAIPDGSLVFFWVKETIAGTEQSFGSPITGRSHIKMMGYIRRETERSEAGTGELTFEIISPLARLGELAGFSKVMEQSASPDAWSKIKTLTTLRAAAQLLQWYCNWTRAGFDFIVHALYTGYEYPLLFLQKDNPLGQVRELAAATDARLVCNRHGRLELQPLPHLLSRAFRDLMTTTLTLTRADWFDIEITREHWRPVETVRCRGFIASAEPIPVFAKWYGDAPGQGNLSDAIERLIVGNTTDLYERCGRHGAFRDGWFVGSNGVGHFAPKVRITLPGSYDVFDFYAEWIELNITTTIRGIDLTQFRFTLESVNVTDEAGTATTELVLQTETFGEAGTDDTPDSANTGDLGDPIWGDITFPAYDPSDLLSGNADICLIESSGLTYTADFTSSIPAWARESWLDGSALDFFNAGETLVDGVQKPGTPRTVFIATTTHARIMTNILQGTTQSSSYALTGTSNLRTVQAERGNGAICYIISNYGASGYWSEGHINGTPITFTPIGAAVNQGGHRPGILVDPDNPLLAYTISHDGTIYRWYKTTDGGVTWNTTSDYNWSPNLRGNWIVASHLDRTRLFVGANAGGGVPPQPIYRVTSASSTQIQTDGGAGFSRSLRTYDGDADLLFLMRYLFITGSTLSLGIRKSTDGGDSFITIAGDVAQGSFVSPIAQVGGDGSVYVCSVDEIRYHPNLYSLIDESQLIDKTGTGYPTGSFIPHNLIGL